MHAWCSDFLSVPNVRRLDPDDADDVLTAKKYIDRAVWVLQAFTDSRVPSASGWAKGGALTLHKDASKVAQLAQEMLNGKFESLVLHGWRQFVAGAIALEAFFKGGRMSDALETYLQSAKWANDDAQTRAYRRELQIIADGEAAPEFASVPRRDHAGEVKYTKIKAYVGEYDVESVAHAILENVAAAVEGVLGEEAGDDAPKPSVQSLKSKLSSNQPWRVSKAEQAQREREMRARELAEEKEWDLV